MAFDKKAYNREYQRTHREQYSGYVKKWRETHPEEARELNRKTVVGWQQRNREKYNAYQRAWHAKRKAELDKRGQA